MSDAIATLAAAVAGLTTTITAYVMSRRSTLADENKSLERRVSDLESELEEERKWSVDMARWAHEASLQAASQGIVLPDMPNRR